MFGTIESTHTKIIDKIFLIRTALDSLRDISDNYRTIATARTGRKYTECVRAIDNLRINLTYDSLESLEINYNLAVVIILADYYESNEREEKNTREYYRIISSENIIAGIEEAIGRTRAIINSIHSVLQSHVVSRAESKETEYELDDISKKVDHAQNIEVNIALEKRSYEVCKCGTRMTVVPELSELHCENPVCLKVKTIIGAVFRDDQFYPQEGQKTKHGGYDTSRHYRFWMERLQALETKTFNDKDLANIEYVIGRDGYERRELTCEVMREILKDPKVGATNLNDHAPLLVKIFGGKPPPILDFQENRSTEIRFDKAMRLYDIVNPDGGNKPYYPYFIYKIVEHTFENNPEKLRLLDYIHLQSRETVIKNDKYYEQMVALSDPEDGLAYHPTDPAGRL
jgi:hypothetical protein